MQQHIVHATTTTTNLLQGCTIGYAMLAAVPEMNDKISVMLHMGPVVFVEFFKAPFLSVMADAKNAWVRCTATVLSYYDSITVHEPRCREKDAPGRDRSVPHMLCACIAVVARADALS